MIAIPPSLSRSAFDDAPDAMIILDAFGIVWFANRRVSALFGYLPDEVIGESIEKLVPERFRAQDIGRLGHLLTDVRVCPTEVALDLYGRRRDGTEFPLEVSLSPIQDVGRTLLAAAIRDVTDRKRMEAELVVARDGMEALRDLADRANQGKTHVLRAASHDLRQPLQALALHNGTLRRLVTDPRALEALSQQEQAIAAMSTLLSDLLDIGNPEA
jgi:protein-histidine pros-kinase